MEKLIHVIQDSIILEGMLKIPQAARGIVLFAHGSGSSRFSSRNNFVAEELNRGGLATLLVDLLSKNEDEVYETRFDIHLLTKRLDLIIQWLKKEPETKNLLLGLFGSSTGAAAALYAASALPNGIKAVVSRGGRPDMAMEILPTITTPTLFIVGGKDFEVLELNQEAFDQLTCFKKLEIISNATHLFEETGCLEEVAELAKKWFQTFLDPEKKSSA